jgi:hypothetical protein
LRYEKWGRSWIKKSIKKHESKLRKRNWRKVFIPAITQMDDDVGFGMKDTRKEQ